MDRLCVCREYEGMFTEGFKYIESLEKHDEKVRADAIDEVADYIKKHFRIGVNTIDDVVKEFKEQNNG